MHSYARSKPPLYSTLLSWLCVVVVAAAAYMCAAVPRIPFSLSHCTHCKQCCAVLSCECVRACTRKYMH